MWPVISAVVLKQTGGLLKVTDSYVHGKNVVIL